LNVGRPGAGAPEETESVSVLRVRGADGLEALDVRGSRRCWRLVHERYCVSLMLAGRTRYRYRGRTLAKARGSVTVHEPGEAYVAGAQEGVGRALVFFLRPELVAALTGGAAPHFRPGPIEAPDVARALAGLAGAMRGGGDRFEIEARLGEALALAIDRCGEAPPRGPGAEPRLVRRVKARLQDAADTPISLEALAREARLHPLHLLRAFRDHVGIPPHAYLIGLRVARARELLCRDLPVASVAARLGFTDQSHLTRHFKALLGITPGAYRPAGRSRAWRASETGP